jgi:hypothetical protein
MIVRRLTESVVAVVLLGVLTACFPGLPGVGGNGSNGGTGGGQVSDELVGTTWSGTDSDGDDWGFEFQADGTVGLTFNGSSYDDDTDTWSVSGQTLAIHTVFVDGDYDFTGAYDGGSSVDLDGSWPGGSFTLTITRD